MLPSKALQRQHYENKHCRLLVHRYHLVRWPDCSTRISRIEPLALLGDMEELWDVLSQGHAGCLMPDNRHLIPSHAVTDLSRRLDSYAQRTEQLQQTALDLYRALKNKSSAGTSLMQSISMKPVEGDMALFDFFFEDVYTCLPVDKLHQDYLGMSVHLIDALGLLLESTSKATKTQVCCSVCSHAVPTDSHVCDSAHADITHVAHVWMG
jgi:hypothetical protein